MSRNPEKGTSLIFQELPASADLSSRDYFAVQAMAVLLAQDVDASVDSDEIAMNAYEIADAMMRTRGAVVNG